MKEKKTKDYSLPFLIVVGLCVILIGCTIAYVISLLKNVERTNTNAIIENKVNLIHNKEINKINNSKDLVYTNISKKNKKNYSFEIPYININSQYAKEINKEISDKYKNIDELIYNAENYPADCIVNISYNVYVNKNILSLIIVEYSGINNYYVYNIDIYTGNKISNSQILLSKNISEESFLNKVEELCTKAVEKIYGNDKDYKKEKSESISYTIKNNKKLTIKMFLDKSNNINIIPTIYNNIAQYDAVEEIINMNL